MDDQERVLINKLIKGISKTKEKDLERLFDLTHKQFCVIAKKYVTDSDVINEILSEGYLQIYRKSRFFNSKTQDGYKWTCEIIENIAIQYSEKHNKE